VGPKNLTPSDRARFVAQSSPNILSGDTSGNDNNTTIPSEEPVLVANSSSILGMLGSAMIQSWRTPPAATPPTQPPETLDQCVFLRGFRIADRFTWERVKARLNVTDGTTTNLKHSVSRGHGRYDPSLPSESQQLSSSTAGQPSTRDSEVTAQLTIASEQGGCGPNDSEEEFEFTRQNFDTVSFFHIRFAQMTDPEAEEHPYRCYVWLCLRGLSSGNYRLPCFTSGFRRNFPPPTSHWFMTMTLLRYFRSDSLTTP
jgi:hypothetical protein